MFDTNLLIIVLGTIHTIIGVFVYGSVLGNLSVDLGYDNRKKKCVLLALLYGVLWFALFLLIIRDSTKHEWVWSEKMKFSP